MLDGWYCRSIKMQNKEDDESQDESGADYKQKYKAFKRKVKYLIYENESFQEILKASQRSLLKCNRDCSFLLDRLLQYEKVDLSSSESEETESSDDGEVARPDVKRRKHDTSVSSYSLPQTALVVPKNQPSAKKKKPSPKIVKQVNIPPLQVQRHLPPTIQSDGHMTPEEVERHLESRQRYLELVPERAPPTVPTEMFSNDPSLDSESHEMYELETSPSNLEDDCLSIDMLQE